LCDALRVRVGETVAGRFVVERHAAGGGMGEVYRALDRHTERPAALKILHASDGQALERFVREARVLSELRHPGIVGYLDHGRTATGELYLAMEWLAGEDLATRLASRELPYADSLLIATRTAAALAVAHARGVVHRDVKP
jgi:serine/threonine protein kinase